MRGTTPIAWRVLLGLRGDRRTLGLVIVVPAFLVYLVGEVFGNPEPVAPILLAVFIFFLTYLLTAIGFLRERTAGTLSRVLVAPASRTGVVAGYVLGFGVLATVQALILLVSGVVFLDVEFAHGIALFVLLELLGAATALGIGVVLSLFANTEFQAVQFIPLVITPQVILGGTIRPVDELVWYLEYPARVMPITYLVRGMEYVVIGTGDATRYWTAVAVLTVFAITSLGAAVFVLARAR